MSAMYGFRNSLPCLSLQLTLDLIRRSSNDSQVKTNILCLLILIHISIHGLIIVLRFPSKGNGLTVTSCGFTHIYDEVDYNHFQ